ncbi:hypothetical protein RI543_000242 [Arxiozyma heterogenica]|uniref:Uncharacterized protein n=1 Tax=Arxiozyma heterogenica TaxID=278026 RepID=A0AAN7WUA7_9SACH|nr:hypothetical protein RI543_000242 [Kazachstania heterogenica]
MFSSQCLPYFIYILSSYAESKEDIIEDMNRIIIPLRNSVSFTTIIFVGSNWYRSSNLKSWFLYKDARKAPKVKKIVDPTSDNMLA